MSFDYEAKTDAVVNMLKKHNDTTTSGAALSKDMEYKVANTNIEAASPESTQLKAVELPHVFVRVSDATEEFAGVGPTGYAGVKKTKDVLYDVIGFYGKHGGRRPEADLDRQVYKFARNIEDVFREEYTLSQTAMWCNAEATNFMGPFNVEGTQVKTAWIRLRARYLFR